MPDDLLHRLERDAAIGCGVMALAAIVLSRGSVWTAVSVTGGGLLIGVSLVSIRSGIDELTSFGLGPHHRAKRPQVARAIVRLAGRYALLGILAYVMIARLRMHPLGLMAGASSVVVAAVVEAIRLLSRTDAQRLPRETKKTN